MMNRYFFLLVILLMVSSFHTIDGQSSIEWQKSIGTPNVDYSHKIFTDPAGNLIAAGTEVHSDLTGELRTYFLITKMDNEGQEIWKKYHDIPFQTNNPPLSNLQIGKHHFSIEQGEELINLLVQLGNQFVIYKIRNETGAHYSYEQVPSPMIVVNDKQDKIIATTSCSWQLSCYGPDSITVQKYNAVPDSNFNFIGWTFALKQDLRTTPIQGHYDVDHNDIRMDEDGNVYLLTQIERWDFNFCTDCADIFVDAHSMIFKFDSLGNLVGRKRLNITRAVVSNMQFVSLEDNHLVIRIDDINPSGTALQNTIFYVGYDLDITDQFVLDRHYARVITDEAQHLYGLVSVSGADDPEVHGETDVLVAKFDQEGNHIYKSYYGGSNFDFPVGITTTSDGGIAFIANTSSNDFDVEDNIGFQDIWLVKLREGTTGLDDEAAVDILVSPNPVTDYLHISCREEISSISVYDATGKRFNVNALSSSNLIDVSALANGVYFLSVENPLSRSVFKFVKL